LGDLVSKNPITHKNRARGVAQGVGPEFKPQYQKKKRHLCTSFKWDLLEKHKNMTEHFIDHFTV
jgi:hypothetical protein